MEYIPESAETVRAFLEAEDMAARADQSLSSVHLLLAFFTFPNRAQVLLNERNIDEDLLLNALRVIEEEPQRTVRQIRERARELAKGSGSSDVDCLHVLIAISRLRDAFAYQLLKRVGASLTALRNIAVSYVTGNMPRRYRTLPKAASDREPLLARRGRVARPQVLEVDPPTEASEFNEEPPEESYGEEDEFAPVADAVEAAAEAARPIARPETGVMLKPPPGHAPRRRQAKGEPLNLEEVAPTLAACGVNLTELAQQNQLDRVIGRDNELEALIDILGKRRANNPLLIGPPGVGKTAIVEGLAVKIAEGDVDVAHFAERVLFSLDTGALVAGTSLRGAFSEKIGAIKNEVAQARGRIVVFIDEMHTLMGAGSSGDGPQDAANELKTALARGEFPCIGATTRDEYKKHIEKDPAMERRFSPIDIDEPAPDEAILILEGAVGPYADHHGVDYTYDAVHAAVQLSHRFINERKLPDKAFAVVDLAGSRARRRGAARVERMDIARVIHEWSGVPIERLADADGDRFANAEALIREKFIGHDAVVAATCQAIRRGFAGFNKNRPIGSFLFLGSTGVGKTELVKVLADFLFGRRDAVVRVDMSEHVEAHSVARLIGAQPGYVGYEEGGQLTEALRKRPFQIVLFDEIEKAHRDVLNVLLQILDEGHLTDARGRKVSFTNTLVVMTSNLGADALRSHRPAIGFGGDSKTRTDDLSETVLEAARGELAPELWGRIDQRLVFAPLTRDEVRRVAALQLLESAQTLFGEREIGLSWEDSVLDFLLNNGGYSPDTGARGMRQTIQRYIEAPLAEKILNGDLQGGDRAAVGIEGDALTIQNHNNPHGGV